MVSIVRTVFAATVLLLAIAIQPAAAQTFRGNYTDQNIGAFFSAIEQRNGKTMLFDVNLNVTSSGDRFKVRHTACWIQIIDTGSSPQRIIELFNVRDSKGTAVRFKFTELWAVTEIVNGQRRSECGSGETPDPLPRGSKVYRLSGVG